MQQNFQSIVIGIQKSHFCSKAILMKLSYELNFDHFLKLTLLANYDYVIKGEKAH